MSDDLKGAWPTSILEALITFLDAQGIGQGPLTVQRIGEGYSNLTYLGTRRDARFVLRRGPAPPVAPSTHDMLREARMQRVLRRHGVPVPDVLAVCEDTSVLGVPFYLMEAIEGEVITRQVPAMLDDESGREAIAEASVGGLACLARVPVDAEDVAALGRPAGYLDRQLRTFTDLWHEHVARPLPDFDAVVERLQASLPRAATRGVVHGDYRLGNLMFGRYAPARVAAILDWEMSTLGDPLADLGYFLATWSERGEVSSVMELSPVTKGEGFPGRRELARRYADQTGLPLDALDWYRALALWKSAVFCEEIHQRWRRGEEVADNAFARSLEQGVPDLLRRARVLLT